MEAIILHVTSVDAWRKAEESGEYRTPDLKTTGFIHFCRPAQLQFVLQRYFAGQDHLVAVHVDVDRLHAALRWEESELGMLSFPHLYGALNLDAVMHVETIGPGPHGEPGADWPTLET